MEERPREITRACKSRSCPERGQSGKVQTQFVPRTKFGGKQIQTLEGDWGKRFLDANGKVLPEVLKDAKDNAPVDTFDTEYKVALNTLYFIYSIFYIKLNTFVETFFSPDMFGLTSSFFLSFVFSTNRIFFRITNPTFQARTTALQNKYSYPNAVKRSINTSSTPLIILINENRLRLHS